MEKYNRNDLVEIVKQSKSIADVCRAIGIKPIGGNYKTIHNYIKLYELDDSHFTGAGWNVGERYTKVVEPKSLSDILVKDSSYQSAKLRKRLIKEGYKESKCEQCKLTLWNECPIALELHHMNGNNRDNRLENLQILCCNCHAQTDHYRGNNKR